LEPEHLAATWVEQFAAWFTDATVPGVGVPEANATVFATADADGRPSARTVLLKGFDQRGFVIYTNYTSRKAREAAGLRQGDVAKAMDWSPSKLIRIEGGQVNISTNDLRALLNHYAIKDSRRTTSLLELAKSSRGSSFYDQYNHVLKGGFRDYLAYEAAASVIRQWDPVFISGEKERNIANCSRKKQK